MSKMQMAATGRQRGAVAVLTALCIVALVGILGFVIDLGMLYVRKTELQNAADAAALGGAKELDGTDPGLKLAREKAREIARLNASDFGGTPINISEGAQLNEVVRFGPTADGPWKDADNAVPETSWFIRVNTTPLTYGTRPTWFIRILDNSLTTTTANGIAVAGRTLCEGMPIFACVQAPSIPTCAPDDSNDCGFVKGHTYRIADKGLKDVGPGSIGWLDPVHPDDKGSIIGENDMREVICGGKMICLAPGTYTNRTQNALGDIRKAFNTRFGEYQGNLDDPEHYAACPPDTNIQEYTAKTGPKQWMTSPPSTEYDVKWSSVRPTDVAQVKTGVYPASPGTPYATTSGPFFTPPPSGDPASVFKTANRRMVTVGLATNCDPDGDGIGNLTAGDGVEVVAFARFLLQKKAEKDDFAADPDAKNVKWGFFGEFVELVDTGEKAPPEIKLYR